MNLGGRIGDIVTLLPLGGDAEGITTDGLRYALRNEPLRLGPARGLSNVRLSPTAAVTVRTGLLLVIESPATLRS
jgi:thiamine pyrophosphokinase